MGKIVIHIIILAIKINLTYNIDIHKVVYKVVRSWGELIEIKLDKYYDLSGELCTISPTPHYKVVGCWRVCRNKLEILHLGVKEIEVAHPLHQPITKLWI